MKMDYDLLHRISEQYALSFYVLDETQVKNNFLELKKAFTDIYPKMNIAYSYKTNYLPKICQIINELDGYAEVVSDMEYELAKKLNVNTDKIIFNGPYKSKLAMEEIILNGGFVNIDSQNDFDFVKQISNKYPEKYINIGIRCNFDVEDGVQSRFGVDVETDLFNEIISYINGSTNHLKLRNLHCHFANRSLDYWPNRAKGIFKIIDKFHLEDLIQIDLGGGLFGKMKPSLRNQFSGHIPSYIEYAEAVATQFLKRYKNVEKDKWPELIIEPGSAIVGDAMKFVAPVINIKNVRNKSIATVLGSIYNINPTLNTKNPPIDIYTKDGTKQRDYRNLDFGGYTCIESDYLYKHFDGSLSVGDFVVFGNIGSYSIVLKPPFILPNFPIVSVKDNHISLLKSQETFDDLFHTFIF